MIKIVIIGYGNLAQHLIQSFAKSNTVQVVQIFARKSKAMYSANGIPICSTYNELLIADLYIIAVSDDAIGSVSEQLPFTNRVVVHTSGAVPMTALDGKNKRGVLYPLQTFTKEKAIDFKNIPICLESETESTYIFLETIANTLSTALYKINSEQRKALHLSAVFVNNFVNHLYQIGHEICQEHNIPFDILKPLIYETSQKISTLSPADAQTGPAIRHDKKTLSSHLALIDNDNQKTIYELLTQSIQNYGKKL